VPLLAGLLLMAVLVLPRVVATAWDSLGMQWSALSMNWDASDASAVVVGLLSMVTISLPVLGIVYLLARVVRRTSRRTWVATAGRPVLRSGAVLAGALVLTGVTWAWWPGDQYRPIEANDRITVPQGIAPPSAPASFTGDVSSQPAAAPAGFAQGHWMLVALPQDAVQAIAGDAGNTANPPSSSWPFPFDPPAAPGEGDNQALAVNTVNGSSVFDSALALVWVTDGEDVDQSSEAYALANCTNCQTTAVSFQVVIVIGYAQVVTPENAAVAVNYLCAHCLTQALAMQTVAMLDAMPDEQTLATLSALWAQLEQSSQSFELLPLQQVYDQLVAAQTEILDLLGVSTGVAGTTDSEVEGAVTTGTTTTSEAPAETGTTSTTTEGTSTTESEPTSTEGTTGETTTTESGTTTEGESTTTGETTSGETTSTEGTTTGEAPATTP
jgi:putative peptide zinc metalloprotease protein